MKILNAIALKSSIQILDIMANSIKYAQTLLFYPREYCNIETYNESFPRKVQRSKTQNQYLRVIFFGQRVNRTCQGIFETLRSNTEIIQ